MPTMIDRSNAWFEDRKPCGECGYYMDHHSVGCPVDYLRLHFEIKVKDDEDSARFRRVVSTESRDEAAKFPGRLPGTPITEVVRCTGEAHSNAHIDNCMQCAPRWGWISKAKVKKPHAARYVQAIDELVIGGRPISTSEPEVQFVARLYDVPPFTVVREVKMHPTWIKRNAKRAEVQP